MNTHCQPLPPPVADELLQVVARAICDRPTDNVPQRKSRVRQLVHAVMGFEPRDGLEYMLATIAFGHFQLILNSMRDAFQGQSDALKAKNKTTICALDRMMLEMFKELRVVRRRPLAWPAAEAADDARRTAAARPAASSPAAEAALPKAAVPEGAPRRAVPDAAPDASGPVAADAASAEGAATPAVAGSPATASTVRSRSDGSPSDTAPPDGTPLDFAGFARAMIAIAAPRAEEREPTPAAPASSAEPPFEAATKSAPTPDALADDIGGFLAPSAEGDAGTFADHIAAFEAAYAATMDVLAEARALERAETEETATGD